MRCPSELKLQSFSDGELSKWQAGFLRRHVQHCPNCQRKIADFHQIRNFVHTCSGVDFTMGTVRPVPFFIRYKLAVAAALLVVLMTASTYWISFNRSVPKGPDDEMIEEYLTIYYESGS